MITSVTSVEQLQTLLAQPGALWVFKHSQTCSISIEAHTQVEHFAAAHPQQPIVVITVQTQRPLSNWIATRVAITHQSPQLFLLQGGAVAWSTSHWQITSAAMEAALARLPSPSP